MSRGTLVADACLVITFGSAGRLDVLTQLAEHRVVIAARALAEVRRLPASAAIRAAISAGEIALESVDLDASDESRMLAHFDARAAFRGRGEAEVLALAATRGYIVGSDERAVLRVARERWGAERTAGILDVLIWAIREERLTIAEADALLRQLDVGPGIVKRMIKLGRNLRDLV